MADSNVFNTFSFKRWAQQRKKANIDDESLKRRMEQVNRLKEKLKHERKLLEDAANVKHTTTVVNEFDIEKLIDHLNLGHQITEDGPTLQHEKPEEAKPEEKEEKKEPPRESRPSSSTPKPLKKRPASMASLRSDSRASINSTHSLKVMSAMSRERLRSESDDEDELDVDQLYQKEDDDFIFKELLNYYEKNNHSRANLSLLLPLGSWEQVGYKKTYLCFATWLTCQRESCREADNHPLYDSQRNMGLFKK
uniref:Snurportin-1 n=1 Tax=Steinernema glaseri TaxID=37863 RepID=A0A1I7YRJ5_9BILA